jgi:hypothetical protein
MTAARAANGSTDRRVTPDGVLPVNQYHTTLLQRVNAESYLTVAMTLPPFPEDVPTHPLLVVDYQKLRG